MENKTLDNTNVAEAKAKISDIKVFGNGDLFQLICKASSEPLYDKYKKYDYRVGGKK